MQKVQKMNIHCKNADHSKSHFPPTFLLKNWSFTKVGKRKLSIYVVKIIEKGNFLFNFEVFVR